MKRKHYLTRRSNSYFYVGYRDNTGHLYWVSTKTKKKSEALDFLNSFNPSVATTDDDVCLSNLHDKLTPHLKTAIRANTINQYKVAITELQTALGDKLCTQLIAQDLENFKSKLLKNGRSASRINYFLRGIKASFSHARRVGYIKTNPFLEVSLVREKKIEAEYLTREEFDKLISKVDDSLLRDFFIMSVNTGMRVSEQINLKWSNVKRELGLLIVTNSEDFEVKNSHTRAIPINSKVIMVLETRSSNKNGEYVFNKHGYKLTRDFCTHQFKKAVRAAELSDGFHMHSLRHTCASWLVMKGVPLQKVQKVLGHSSITVTERYAHLAPNDLADAMSTLEFIKADISPDELDFNGDGKRKTKKK